MRRFDVRLLALSLVFVSALITVSPSLADSREPVTTPLPPQYRIQRDGAVTLRICFNSSCRSTKVMTFTAEDMAQVFDQLALCADSNMHERIQRLRIAVWQMEVLAMKYEPLLANDLAVNDQEFGVEGRTDCVDNSTNTTTFLHALVDLGALPGWTVSTPEVRNRFNFNRVHWTATVRDKKSDKHYAVDSWFRPHPHLPFVLPLAGWLEEKPGWLPPFDKMNPNPQYTTGLCHTEKD